MFGDTRRSADPTSRGGFTLTEMMAVMLIMTVLVLLVVGVSRKVQVTTAKSATRSYQAILKRALQAYYEDQKAYPDNSYTDDGAQLFLDLKNNEASERELRALPVSAMASNGFLDGFKKKMRYQKTSGIGGTPVVISAGPDKDFTTEKDNIRSDEGY
jgi:prepilin-type N-terminal cleavage/methylation domain-containing protein